MFQKEKEAVLANAGFRQTLREISDSKEPDDRLSVGRSYVRHPLSTPKKQLYLLHKNNIKCMIYLGFI